MGVLEIAWQCVGLLSSILYLFLVVMLFKLKTEHPFTSSFYRLFSSLGVADLLNILHQNILLKMVSSGTFMADIFMMWPKGILPRFQTMGTLYLAQCQFLGVAALGLNRYQCVMHRNAFAELWNSRRVRKAILVQWIAPLIFVTPLFSTSFTAVRYSNQTGQVLVFYDDPRYLHAYWICIAVGDGIILNLLLALAYLGIYREHALLKQLDHMSLTQADLKLAATGWLIFICMSIYGLLTIAVLLHISGSGATYLWFTLWQGWAELFSWVNVWALLLASPTVRNRFKLFYFRIEPNAVFVEEEHHE